MVRAELQAIERMVREQETAVEINPLGGRSRQADPAERLLPGRAQAAFANPSSRAVHPC